jgi:hypothetical protein
MLALEAIVPSALQKNHVYETAPLGMRPQKL